MRKPSNPAGRRSRALLQQEAGAAAPEGEAAGAGAAASGSDSSSSGSSSSLEARRARRRAEDTAANINKSPMYAAGPTITKVCGYALAAMC